MNSVVDERFAVVKAKEAEKAKQQAGEPSALVAEYFAGNGQLSRPTHNSLRRADAEGA